MPAVAAVIFDMFNTIAEDGRDHWRRTLAEIIAAQHLDTTPEALRQAWDEGSAGFRARRLDPAVPFISYLDGWADAFAVAFRSLNLAGDPRAAAQKSIDDLGYRPLWPDAAAALEIIARHRRIAVLSNADDAYLDPVVARVPARFAAVISSQGARCYKPDPRLFAAAAAALNVAPAQCVYVGDRQFEDVKGAHGAGMSAVWINRFDTPLDPSLPAPDAAIRSLLELPAVLTQLELEPESAGNPHRRRQ